jgi:hypothetical protein
MGGSNLSNVRASGLHHRSGLCQWICSESMSISNETPTLVTYALWSDTWIDGKSYQTYQGLIAPVNWNGYWRPPREIGPRDAPGWPFVHIV